MVLHPARLFMNALHRVVEQEPAYQDEAYQEPAYDNSNDDYYYLPDVDAYYSVDQQCYYYNDGDNWVSAAYLPGDFSDYDWRYAPHYQVRAMRPYLHNDFYREHYNGHFIGNWNHNTYTGNVTTEDTWQAGFTGITGSLTT